MVFSAHGGECMKQNLTSPGIARFTKVLLDILFYAGIAVTVSLPWTMRWAARFYPSFAERLTLHTVLFFLAGVCAVLILFELRRMMRTVVSGDCFVRRNVASLSRMTYYAFAIAALMAVRLVVLFTPGMFAIVCVFLLAGLFSLVLAQVFDRAVSYKQDNDLTI